MKERWTHGFEGSAFRIHDSTAVVISSRDVYGMQRLRIALCIAVQSWWSKARVRSTVYYVESYIPPFELRVELSLAGGSFYPVH